MKNFFLIIFILLILFSCGIEEIIYLEPPISTNNPTHYSDDSKKYFGFKTTDKINTDNVAGYFKGFDVFYKIYKDENSCKAENSKAINYNELNPANATNYLISNLSYSFLTYNNKSSDERPLITANPTDRVVGFRLTASSGQMPILTIDGTSQGSVKRKNLKDFSAFSKEDSDVGFDPEGEVFVSIFVATYGSDQYFKQIYSKIVHLGYIKIPI